MALNKEGKLSIALIKRVKHSELKFKIIIIDRSDSECCEATLSYISTNHSMTAAEDKIKPLPSAITRSPFNQSTGSVIVIHSSLPQITRAMDDNHSYYYPVGVEIIIELAVEKPSWQQSTAACR